MRFVIFGAGAIGGAVGARLAEGGLEVALIARGAHLEAIRRDGLTFETPVRSTRAGAPGRRGSGGARGRRRRRRRAAVHQEPGHGRRARVAAPARAAVASRSSAFRTGSTTSAWPAQLRVRVRRRGDAPGRAPRAGDRARLRLAADRDHRRRPLPGRIRRAVRAGHRRAPGVALRSRIPAPTSCASSTRS